MIRFKTKENNLVSIAIFLSYKKMLPGHEKVKMVLEMQFQDKMKFKRCNCEMQKIYSRKALLI